MSIEKCSIKGCNKIMFTKDTKSHGKECEHRIVACPLSKKLKCPDFIKIKDLKNHIQNVHNHPRASKSKTFSIVWVDPTPKQELSDGNPKFLKNSTSKVCALKKINGQDFVLLIESSNKNRLYKITPFSLENPKDAEKFEVQITAMNPENLKKKIWFGQMNDVFDDKESKEFFSFTSDEKDQLTGKKWKRISFELNLVRCVPKKSMVQNFIGKFKTFQKQVMNKV